MRKRIFRSGISLMLTAAMLAGSMAVAEPVKADETAGTVGTDPDRDRTGSRVRHFVDANRQQAARSIQTALHESLGGAQGRRTGLRSGRSDAESLCRTNYQIRYAQY